MRFAGDTFSQAVEQEEENPSTLNRYFPDLKNIYKKYTTNKFYSNR